MFNNFKPEATPGVYRVAKLIILSIFARTWTNINICMEDNKQLDIELNSDVAKGSYCNLSIITHSPNEFVLDFLKILPGFPKAVVTERIIMTPENAKRLASALADNIGKYEEHFGSISLHNPEIAIPIKQSQNKS